MTFEEAALSMSKNRIKDKKLIGRVARTLDRGTQMYIGNFCIVTMKEDKSDISAGVRYELQIFNHRGELVQQTKSLSRSIDRKLEFREIRTFDGDCKCGIEIRESGGKGRVNESSMCWEVVNCGGKWVTALDSVEISVGNTYEVVLYSDETGEECVEVTKDGKTIHHMEDIGIVSWRTELKLGEDGSVSVLIRDEEELGVCRIKDNGEIYIGQDIRVPVPKSRRPLTNKMKRVV
jgi:hypothetical protein